MGGKIVSTGMKRVTAFLGTHMTSMFSAASLLVASPARYSQKVVAQDSGRRMKPVPKVPSDCAVDACLVQSLPHGSGLRLASRLDDARPGTAK